ncbi:MAG: peptidase T [Coprobacillus sp.]|nr:peptidase T [Coprobacillus sp.]
MELLDNLFTYLKIDTQADDSSTTVPSAEKEKDLSKLLVEQLNELGLSDAYMDENGVVYAHLEGEDGVATIGLNSHVDTAEEVTDTNVKPQLIKNYDGGTIILNDEYKMDPVDFPILKEHVGHDLVTASGDTLLGADDKAGITIIMEVLKRLTSDKTIKHHPISVCFTVDEEIGKGPLHFSLSQMRADYCYTIDGSYINDIGIKNFDAYRADIKITGNSIHPGEGKGKLMNAALLYHEFLSYLPKNDSPYNSKDFDGFWHIVSASGNSEYFESYIIIRDFHVEGINKRISKMYWAAEKLRKKYKGNNFDISVEITPQYENMYQYLTPDCEAVTKADAAIRKNGLTPTYLPIRGGTDGATFTKMGLITPNLGTGSYNHHGRFEFIDLDELNKMVDIVTDIVKI